MKKVLSIAIIPLMSVGGAQATVINFNYTGATQSWVAPTGASSVKIMAYGGQGGNSVRGARGGGGGLATGELDVTVGEALRINIGGQGGSSAGGFNGGGNGGYSASTGSRGAGGGGATDIRQGGTGLASRVLVAGGGGGAGGDRVQSRGPGSGGGGGGGYFGGGGGGGYQGSGGLGGSQVAGGSGGIKQFSGNNGSAGTLGVGGSGGNAPTNSQGGSAVGSGGGAGGGLTGQAGATGNPNWRGGGGGGGSSYIGGVENGRTATGTSFGNGSLQLEYFLADILGSPAPGSILDLGSVAVGGAFLTGGALSVENTGEAQSSLNLLGFTGFDSLFSLATGDDMLSLVGDGVAGAGADIEDFVFGFDATGLTAGLYSTDISLASNAGSLSYTLQARVFDSRSVRLFNSQAVPEPGSLALLGLGLAGLGLTRRRRSKA